MTAIPVLVPPTSGCARCGDCCDPVTIEASAFFGCNERARLQDVASHNDVFITQYWHPLSAWTEEDGVWLAVRCDAFDPETRLCTAGESRPPVCSGYPWYGERPVPGKIPYLHCSYQADLLPGQRTPGSRPLIPLTPAGA